MESARLHSASVSSGRISNKRETYVSLFFGQRRRHWTKISQTMDNFSCLLGSTFCTLPTLYTAISHVKMCRWLTSYVPPLSISSIVVSLWLAGCLAKSTLIGWREYYGGGGVGVDDTCVEPSKREDLTQYCFNIGPPPTALDQHWNNIGSNPRVCWESCPHFDTRVPSVSVYTF